MKHNRKRLLSLFAMFTGLTTLAAAQTGTITTTSLASYDPVVAPDSIAAGWGMNLASATNAATGLPLPTALGNVQVSIMDSKGATFSAPLFMVSPSQINFVVPENVALGRATVTVATSSGNIQGALYVSNVSPAIFTANMNGKGVPAAQVLRVNDAGKSTVETPISGTAQNFTPSPINLGSDHVYLMLYGSGLRRHSANPVEATIGGVKVPVLYAGAQSQFPGLDQVNLGPLPTSLAGKGTVDLKLLVDGVPANTVQLAFQ